MIEESYILQLSSHLRNFKKIAPNKYRCSCNICGDSKKIRSAARGNFFMYRGEFFYKCYNCGESHSLKTYLKMFFPDMYNEYIYDKFGYSKKTKKPELEIHTEKPVFRTLSLSGDDIIQLDYDSDHHAVQYLKGRLLTRPMIQSLYYTENFKAYINDTFIPNKFKHPEGEDPRIVIPFFSMENKLIGLQGRSTDLNNPVRYVTIKLIGENEPLLYGLDKIDQSKDVYVFEGPVDSMFVDNACAYAGGSLNKVDGVLFPILVWDNDLYKNKDIAKQVRKAIADGFKVVLWETKNKFKDVNDMVIGGMTIDHKYLRASTYQGLDAEIVFNQRCKL